MRQNHNNWWKGEENFGFKTPPATGTMQVHQSIKEIVDLAEV